MCVCGACVCAVGGCGYVSRVWVGMVFVRGMIVYGGRCGCGVCGGACVGMLGCMWDTHMRTHPCVCVPWGDGPPYMQCRADGHTQP